MATHQSMQRNLPPMAVPKVDCAELQVHKVDLTLDVARQLVGAAVTEALAVTQSDRKALGDKSQVGRWCAGEDNPNVARLVANGAGRAFAIALLRRCRGVKVTTRIEVDEEVAS